MGVHTRKSRTRRANALFRYLQPGEFQAILEHCPDWLRPVAVLAVNTGMRRSEMLKLRPLDVDLHHGRVLLRQTKNGESRVVYLNAAAHRMLQAAGPEIFTRLDAARVS